MEWTITISLILVGFLLLLIEILFIPGTTVAGILGFVLMVWGVSLSFSYFGNQTGWIITGTTFVVGGVGTFYSFKSNLWGRFALKGMIKSKVHQPMEHLQVGMEGVTTSALRPIGNAEFLGQRLEVTTLGEYLSNGVRIRIKKLSSNQIIVEPIQ